MYQLLESYYEDVKDLWEDRFEKKYGFWRSFVDSVVACYLDCGVAEACFARLKCEACGSERLLTRSCKQRAICPSCDAKRAAGSVVAREYGIPAVVGVHDATTRLRTGERVRVDGTNGRITVLDA